MLPFGSLLTQLPLLIIGGLYMLYLGFYAVNRTKEAPLSADSELKEQFAGYKSAENAVDYFSFVSVSQEKENSLHQQVSAVHIVVSYIVISYYIPDTGLISYHPGYCLFSRPPPSAA
jgi:hypothetical protein